MRYRGEIDGLRSVAVVPVILFHAGFGAFSGGFVGVDVFFVISGYLITTIIANEIAAGGFSLARFYERRARRILPALFLVICTSIPLAWWLMDPFELKEFGQSIVSTVTFSSNIYFYLKTGYFDTASELKPLLHTWSLAVEEQFYILFPLLLMAVWRLGGRTVTGISVVLTLISFALAEYGVHNAPSATFFMLHSRAWELSIGALIAVYLRRSDVAVWTGPVAQGLSALGLVLVMLPIGLYDAQTPFPGLYAIPPVVGTALIILGANEGTLVHRILTQRLLIRIGLVSYAAYLWHQPIFAFIRIYTLEELTPLLGAAGMVLTFVLAVLTKWLVEDPVRHRILKQRRGWVLSIAAVASVALAIFGGMVHMQNGVPGRSPLGLTLAQNYGLSATCSGAALDAPRCQSSEQASTLLWGDSLAMHIGRALSQAESGIVQATLSGCPPIQGYTKARRKAAITCEDFNDRVVAALADRRFPDVTRVVMASTFTTLRNPAALAQFKDTLAQVRAAGYDVVLVTPTPTNAHILKCIKLASRRGTALADCSYPLADLENADVFEVLGTLAETQGVPLVDLRQLTCRDGQCLVAMEDTILYRDNIHFANGADDLVAEFLKRSLPSTP